ncbi:DUF4238 domain-containing protein [Ruegeria halocynthiae]
MIPKLHHYVPQLYLRGFASGEGKLWAFNVKEKRLFPTV